MYTKEFYHTCEDAREAAVNAAGQTGIIQDGDCTATGFDYISRDAINDDRDGDCKAFIVTGQDGNIIGVYAYAEEKPDSTMPYITDEHFYEREPADSFKYKLAEYMTKCCTKREGIYGYSYSINSESILQMAKEELIKRGELKEQKPAEYNAFKKWVEDYWSHNKVNNPYSYNKGDEVQFDHKGFVSFCEAYCYPQNLVLHDTL